MERENRNPLDVKTFKSVDQIDVDQKVSEALDLMIEKQGLYKNKVDEDNCIKIENYKDISGARPEGNLKYMIFEGKLKFVSLVWRTDLNYSHAFFIDIGSARLETFESLEEVLKQKEIWLKNGLGDRREKYTFSSQFESNTGEVSLVQGIKGNLNVFLIINFRGKFEVIKFTTKLN